MSPAFFFSFPPTHIAAANCSFLFFFFNIHFNILVVNTTWHPEYYKTENLSEAWHHLQLKTACVWIAKSNNDINLTVQGLITLSPTVNTNYLTLTFPHFFFFSFFQKQCEDCYVITTCRTFFLICVFFFGSDRCAVCCTAASEEGAIDSVRGGGHQGEHYHLRWWGRWRGGHGGFRHRHTAGMQRSVKARKQTSYSFCQYLSKNIVGTQEGSIPSQFLLLPRIFQCSPLESQGVGIKNLSLWSGTTLQLSLMPYQNKRNWTFLQLHYWRNPVIISMLSANISILWSCSARWYQVQQLHSWTSV